MLVLPVELVKEVLEQFELDPEIQTSSDWLPLSRSNKLFHLMVQQHLYKSIIGSQLASEAFSRTIKQKPQLARLVRHLEWSIAVKLFSLAQNSDGTVVCYSPSQHYAQLVETLKTLSYMDKVEHLAVRFGVKLPTPGERPPSDAVTAFKIGLLPTSLLQPLSQASFPSLIDLTYIGFEEADRNAKYRYSALSTWASLCQILRLTLRNTGHVEDSLPHQATFAMSLSNLTRLAIVPSAAFDVNDGRIGQLARSCSGLSDLKIDFRSVGGIFFEPFIDRILEGQPIKHVIRLAIVWVEGDRLHGGTCGLQTLFPGLQHLELTPYDSLSATLKQMFPPATAFPTLRIVSLNRSTEALGEIGTIHSDLSIFTKADLYPNLRNCSFSCQLDIPEAMVGQSNQLYSFLVQDLSRLSKKASGQPELKLEYHFAKSESCSGRMLKGLHAHGGGEVHSTWCPAAEV